MRLILTSIAALGLATAPLLAQTQNQEGLVNVAVGDIGIDALNNTNVQVPIGIAAQVCGVDANIIAKQKEQALTNCKVDQTNANEAFLNFVSKKRVNATAQLVERDLTSPLLPA
jgi:hypothetical protein